MQLVFKGNQDVHLTGNPQITFFKMLHKRYSNFSMESIQQQFNGSADFGRKLTCLISRNGDLVHKIYLQIELPQIDCGTSNDNKFRWLNWIGHNIVKSAQIEIGGHVIDQHYGEWLHIWNELSQTSGKQSGVANMIGNLPRLTQVVQGNSSNTGVIPATTLYVPLQFWFCKNPGLALPLIALQYNEIKLVVEFNEHNNCCWATGKYKNTPPSIKNASLYIDYIYLDTEERRKFTSEKHEYLIEQVQYNGQETVNTQNNKIKLNFNNPVKELIWVVQPISNIDTTYTANLGGPQFFNYTDSIDTTYFSGTPNNYLGQGMTGGSSNNIMWGLPITDFASSTVAGTSNITAPQTGQSNSTALTNTNFYDITTQNVHSQASTSSVSNLPLFDKGKSPTINAKIQINSHDRISIREGRYFNLVQPYQHHTNIPAPGINTYSFALYPEDLQPSGTCNFSQVDSANLLLTLTPESVENQRLCNIRIYATSYNIFKINDGIGRLTYAK